jgi:hypothetical protein
MTLMVVLSSVEEVMLGHLLDLEVGISKLV